MSAPELAGSHSSAAPKHYRAPARLDQIFNSAVRWLADRGVNLAGAQTLTVVGRSSGTPQRIPVNPYRHGGREYLVSVRGESQWVRNARSASGVAELRRGRRRRDVVLAEVPVAERSAIIQGYLGKWGWEVGRLLPEGLDVDATAEQIQGYATQIPVFRVG